MIKKVSNQQELIKFIQMVKDLYQDNDFYVLPFFDILKRELSNLVLKQMSYHAIMYISDNKVMGRLLYTFEEKQNDNKICYFSFFDAYNDLEVSQALFDYLEEECKKNRVDYIEGTFSPYDPDTRRGVLIDGFDIAPTLFTSYNYPYYQDLIEQSGFIKKVDTYSLKANVDDNTYKKLNTIATYVDKKMNIKIDPLRLKHITKDIKDVHEILKHATSDHNYQDAPSIEMIEHVAKNLKLMIDPKLIIIAREKQTNRPIGFCLVLPDYNQLFKKMHGKLQLLKILFQKKSIKKARGMLQYVIPEYQSTGVIGAMFHRIFVRFLERGIIEFEAGTMLEENLKPLTVFDKFGGKIIKTYRIYRKELKL